MAATMNDWNLNKIVQSYDKKFDLKPTHQEALRYLGLRKGVTAIMKISHDDGLHVLSEPTTELKWNDNVVQEGAITQPLLTVIIFWCMKALFGKLVPFLRDNKWLNGQSQTSPPPPHPTPMH